GSGASRGGRRLRGGAARGPVFLDGAGGPGLPSRPGGDRSRTAAYVAHTQRKNSVRPLNEPRGGNGRMGNGRACPRSGAGSPGRGPPGHAGRPEGEGPGRRPLFPTPAGGGGGDVREVAAGGRQGPVERHVHPRRV